MIKEIWKDIQGYKGLYQISNYGKVKSLYKNKLRSFSIDNSGYYHISLTKDKKQRSYLLSRLVALHFVKNSNKKQEVNHKDGNKNNNMSSNLEWSTRQENIKHAFKMGLNKTRKGELCNFSKINNSQRTRIKELFNINIPKMNQYLKLSKMFNLSERQIRYIINGK